MEMNLLERYIKQILREGKINSMTLFHGTDITNLSGIINNGLDISNWNKGWAAAINKGVYLTPQLDKAARYAIGGQFKHTPVIFEIVLSGHKRFKKVKYDPLDRPESEWDEEEGFNYLEGIERNIAHGIKNILNDKETSYYSWDLEKLINFPRDASEPTDLKNYNLYKELISYLTANSDLPRSKIVSLIHKEFPTHDTLDDNGYIEITENGSLRPTKEWFSTREQLLYSRSIPPGAIKSVIVRLADHPSIPENSYSEIFDIAPKHLPQEAKQAFERKMQQYKDIQDKIFEIGRDYQRFEINGDDDNQNGIGALEEMIVDLTAIKDDDNDELINNIQELIEIIKEYWAEVITKKELARKIDSVWRFTQHLEPYEQYGQDKFGASEKWGKLTPVQAIKLVSKEPGIQYRLPFHKSKKKP
jgi:hypothetical protein